MTKTEQTLKTQLESALGDNESFAKVIAELITAKHEDPNMTRLETIIVETVTMLCEATVIAGFIGAVLVWAFVAVGA